MRFELTTARLRIGCSTPELLWHVPRNSHSLTGVAVRALPDRTPYSQKHWHRQERSASECPGADSNRYAFRHHPLKMACLPISPPGQNLSPQFRSCRETELISKTQNTGPTGLEPATSRVTVECSNQAELRPQLLKSGSKTLSSPRTCLESGLVVKQSAAIAPRGIEPLSAP